MFLLILQGFNIFKYCYESFDEVLIYWLLDDVIRWK